MKAPVKKEIETIKTSLKKLHKMGCVLDAVDNVICLVDARVQKQKITEYDHAPCLVPSGGGSFFEAEKSIEIKTDDFIIASF